MPLLSGGQKGKGNTDRRVLRGCQSSHAEIGVLDSSIVVFVCPVCGSSIDSPQETTDATCSNGHPTTAFEPQITLEGLG